MTIFILVAFLFNTISPVSVHAQELSLPKPGVMVHLSPEFNPPILKGIKVHPDNPFRFEFILDKGDSSMSSPNAVVGDLGLPAGQAGLASVLDARQKHSGMTDEQLKQESTKLIKYFLASITTPEKDMWVNLSPYEKDRIVPESFGQTEMGRDLLAQDYMLKQVTASLIYPEDEVGKKFWKRVYEEAAKKYGTTNIPVNTFNKVWIVPEKAVVFENTELGAAYVVESRLKVMLEEDYLSMTKHDSPPHKGEEINLLGSQIVREIVIPELTKEINEGKNFAQLRQVYDSLILATWYKKRIRDSVLSKVYADKSKMAGLNIDDFQDKEKIYKQYLKAFKKGVYNFIKEDIDPVTRESIPRKYFSGGMSFDKAMNVTLDVVKTVDSAQLGKNENLYVVSSGANQVFNNKTNDGSSQLERDKAMISLKGLLEGIQKKIGALTGKNPLSSIFLTYVYMGLVHGRSVVLASAIADTFGLLGFGNYFDPTISEEQLKPLLPDYKVFRNRNILKEIAEEGIEKFKFFGIDSIRDTILDPNNKNGIWEVSQTKVRLKPNTNLKEEDVRKIVKGDFDKIWAILEKAQELAILEEVYSSHGKTYRFQVGKGPMDIPEIFKDYPRGSIRKAVEKAFAASKTRQLYQDFIKLGAAAIGLAFTSYGLGDRGSFMNMAQGTLGNFSYFFSYSLLFGAFGFNDIPSLRGLLAKTFTSSGVSSSQPSNPAMITSVAKTPVANVKSVIDSQKNGGIDLTSASMDVQTKNSGKAIVFQLDPAQLAELQNSLGFVPVIYTIEPMRDLNGFLGVPQ
ncbi:MAG: hypothetical protein HQL15_02360 [Candidatus Omnitrophica bacterium]|nr:hypothetical protein [Candidatus Omnitrophota bacterium]